MHASRCWGSVDMQCCVPRQGRESAACRNVWKSPPTESDLWIRSQHSPPIASCVSPSHSPDFQLPGHICMSIPPVEPRLAAGRGLWEPGLFGGIGVIKRITTRSGAFAQPRLGTRLPCGEARNRFFGNFFEPAGGKRTRASTNDERRVPREGHINRCRWFKPPGLMHHPSEF